jgi:hypothetical protein
MAAKPRTYHRLPGRSSSVVARYRVYGAADHLLAVSNYGFSESYKRFYFRDIQAIVVQRTEIATTLTVILSLLTGLAAFFWIVFMISNDRPTAIYVFIVTALFAALLAVNLVLGPTCHCYVKTAVQTERLNAVGRIRTARKFLARVRPLIENAQTTVSRVDTPAASSPAPAGGQVSAL